MRVTTPQITWHGGENGKNDPVLSADVHPCGVLATGGADADIRVWKLHLEEDKEEKDFQDFLYNLEGHEKSVNVVRFSPNGRVLASASDGGTIILYRLPDDRPLRTWCFASKAKKVVEVRVLRTTQEDVYDLCWSPSSQELVSASVDHKVFVWNATTGKHITFFDDHSNYVQGVCWDPREKYLASESNDRSCRVYARKMTNKGRKKKKDKAAAAAAAAAAATPQGQEAAADGATAATAAPTTTTAATTTTTTTSSSSKKPDLAFTLHCTLRQVQRPAEEKPAAPVEEPAAVPAVAQEPTEPATTKSTEPIEVSEESNDVMIVERVPAPAPPAPAPPTTTKRPPRLHLFADETVPTFFRRASWSPDGCLLVTPTGVRRETPQSKVEFVTHVWARDHFDKPVMQLPCGKKASVAVRFCPQLFKLRETKEPTKHLTNLPYRMVYAVLTVNAVLVYDTQHFYPIAMVSNTHLASLTDAAWLPDGSALVATSMDGYVTVLAFPDRELGEPLDGPSVPPVVRKLHLPIYEQKERDAEDEELDRLEEKERAELAAAKAQAAIERQQQLEAKKAAEEERRRKLQLLKEQQKQEQKTQDADDSDDEDEVIIVERSKRKEPAASETAKPQRDDDEEESLKSKDTDAASSDEEQELEEEEVEEEEEEEEEEEDKEAFLRRVRALEEEDNGLATESEAEEDEDEESDKEEDKMDDEEEEADEEEGKKGSGEQKKEAHKDAAQAEAKAEATVAAEEKVSQRKRNSDEVLQGAQKDTGAETGKDVTKKPKRIAPTLVQPLAPSDASNSSAPPTPRVATTAVTATAASTTPTGQAGGDSASRPKKRVAPTLISGPSA